VARIVEATLPADLTDDLLEELDRIPLVAGIHLQRGASLKPPGDVLTVELANRSLHPLLRLLHGKGIGVSVGGGYSVSEPVALVQQTVADTVLSESTDCSWEEMDQLLARESSMTVNALILMMVAGALSTIGISTGALHLVVAAMVIAPGFEPFTRLALGVVAGGRALGHGLGDMAKGYLALVLGSAATAALLPALGTPPLMDASYLGADALLDYWTTSKPASLLLALLAGAAGAVLVATNRTVLTAGVMIALALIPTASLVGAGLAAGAPSVAGQAALRWLFDALLVIFASLLVLWWKRRTVQRRSMHF
jgi:hypothetical protein